MNSERVTLADTLAVFERAGDANEPRTASEIADELECTRRTAYNKLDELDERGDVRSKKVGARSRVWWIESDSSDRELRRERDLIERILDTSPVGIAVLTPDGTITHANERAETLLDITYDEETDTYANAIDRPVYDADGDLLPPERRPFARTAETGQPVYDEEVQVETSAGDRRWLSVNVTPMFDEDGGVDRIIAAGKDVTSLKTQARQLERQRDELEAELAEVLERIDDGFFALDSEFRFTYVNDRAEELLDCPKSEALGRDIREVIPITETAETAFTEALETQDPVTFEDYYDPLDAWFENQVSPSETGISLYYRDISDQKRRERQLERYETIVETVQDGIYVLNDDMEFSMVNTALTEMTGYDREELLGTPAGEITDDVWETVEKREAEIRSGDRSSATVEVDVETRDGDTFSAEATWVPRSTDDGYERVGVVRDVTERKERERELQNRVEQQRALSEFSRYALEDRSLDDLFDEAVELVADTLDHDYCKVLELFPEDGELLLRNGVGWRDDIVGSATVVDDRASQAGYTLVSEGPVVVEDLETEDRFSGPELLTSHDVKGGISTIIGTPDDPWGILGTHDTDEWAYTDHDVQFVQRTAHILYTAIRRREREQQLERYETIVETVEDGVYALDSDERFVMVNEAFLDMTGYEREELLGRHASLVHTDEINERAAAMSDAVTDELGSATLEVDLRSKDGGTIPVESRFGPYRYGSEEFARTGVVRDITERRQLEETLTALYVSARELLGAKTKDEVAEIAVETVTDILDLSGVVTYLYDEEAGRLYPAAQSSESGFMREELPAVPPDDSSITGHVYATGDSRRFDDVTDSSYLQANATEMRAGVFASMGDHGVIVVGSRAVGGFDERTQRLVDLLAANAEAAFDAVEREHELASQNERLDGFASMLAHELRNPLTIGQMYCHELPAEVDSETVDYIAEAFDRIENMIDVMLVLTQGREAVDDQSRVRLAEMARDAWDDVDTTDATLDVSVDDVIRADETYIRHLFSNLFENAVEHGGPDVTVTVGEMPTGFYVADTGSGIPPGERDAVFEAGYTTAAKYGGTGLGLAFVRELAEVYGWECAVTESDAGGARFEFTNVDRDPERS
ncbi:PAS domain S-box protein [Halomicrococcus sp. SG-WS-1]|uniref:PAS domain S-box protein n=1 Tax=Halomicrococcus sp. SG-WS-1 TaxID=3439057 RepID=UPI003F7924E8